MGNESYEELAAKLRDAAAHASESQTARSTHRRLLEANASLLMAYIEELEDAYATVNVFDRGSIESHWEAARKKVEEQ